MNYTLYESKDAELAIKPLDLDLPVMFDTETIDLYGTIRLAQFYQEGLEKAIIIEYPDPMWLAQFIRKYHIVAHNITYDISTIQDQLGKLSWPIDKDRIDDTMLLSRLHYYREQKFALDYCLYYLLGEDYNPEGIDKKAMQKANWAGTLGEQQLEYAANDVINLQALYNEVKLAKMSNSYLLDMASVANFLSFQTNGLPVDKAILQSQLEANMAELDRIKLPVNSKSSQQVCAYIGSQDAQDLTLAKLEIEGNTKARDVRRSKKLRTENSYLLKFDTLDGRIYGKFAPSARSGRSTCKDQNLQQLPRSSKGCFGVHDPGTEVMVYSDFSQLELRCVCAITGESKMEQLFRDDEDLHMITAKALYNTEAPTKEERQIAKTCNFGLLYGAGSKVLGNILATSAGISVSDLALDGLKRRWLNMWPTIAAWQQTGIEAYYRKQPWYTPNGRPYVAKMMTDQLNIKVQGMGSEVARLANHYLFKENADAKQYQCNFIHDSYIFVMPNIEEDYKKLCDQLVDAMQKAWVTISQNCLIKDLPMPVEVLVGYNWRDIESGKNILYTKKEK